MSVLIEDMEMPRTCYDCKFRKRNGLELICPVLEKSYKIADTQVLFVREKDCPLIEATEPHGRLIDADEFLKRALGTECFRDDFALMLEELVGESTTIIPASKED